MTKQSIETRIKALHKQGNNIQLKVNELAIECLEHAAANDGDFTLMTKLYHALPSIVRRGTFVEWVKAYSPAKFVAKTAGNGAKIKVFQKDKGKDAKAWNIAGAMAINIQDFEVPKGVNEAEPLTCEELDNRIVNLLAIQLDRALKRNDRVMVSHIKAHEEKLGLASKVEEKLAKKAKAA
jgi:hypothetical protein